MPCNDLSLSLVPLITDERSFGHWGLYLGLLKIVLSMLLKPNIILIYSYFIIPLFCFPNTNFFSFFLALSHDYIVIMCRKMQLNNVYCFRLEEQFIIIASRCTRRKLEWGQLWVWIRWIQGNWKLELSGGELCITKGKP